MVTIPDGARYVLITCIPAGDETRAEAQWDDGQLDATAALTLLDMARAEIARRAEQEIAQAARLRLLSPVGEGKAIRTEKNANAR